MAALMSSSAAYRFSLAHLRELYQTIEQNKDVNSTNAGTVVEVLRLIAEMVVYGDSKSEMLFDFFCEKNMLALFLELMSNGGGCPIEVHVQILQTLGILVNSVRNDTSLYYLLSNNYINDILMHPHDFLRDESLCDQYVSFMKSLSLRLDEKTVQFFFIEETGAFPLLEKAISLLNFSEPMVRIAAQTTVLNIYQVRDSRSREYALKPVVLDSLFQQISSLSREKFATILTVVDEHSLLVRAVDANNQGLDPTDSAVLFSMDRNNHWGSDKSGGGLVGRDASSVNSYRGGGGSGSSSSSGSGGKTKHRKAKKMTPGRLAKAMSNLDILEENVREAEDENQQSVQDPKGLHEVAASEHAGGEGGDGAGGSEVPTIVDMGPTTIVDMGPDSQGNVASLEITGAPSTSNKSADTANTVAAAGTNETAPDDPAHVDLPAGEQSAEVAHVVASTPSLSSSVVAAVAEEKEATNTPKPVPVLDALAHVSASKDVNRIRLKQMENTLCDAVSAADDWLYFLQDLLGLHIFHLRFGLVSNLLENWIIPNILPLLTAPEDVLMLASDRDGRTEGRLLDVKRGMLFLTQILRIVQDRLMQRAILVSLLHPNSASERAMLLARHAQDEEEQGLSLQVQAQDATATATATATGTEHTNLHRLAVDQLLKYVLQPASPTVFDLTSDHLAFSVSLLLQRVYENAISIGRYRELQSGERSTYFAGLRYEMSFLNHLQLVTCGGDALPVDVDVNHVSVGGSAGSRANAVHGAGAEHTQERDSLATTAATATAAAAAAAITADSGSGSGNGANSDPSKTSDADADVSTTAHSEKMVEIESELARLERERWEENEKKRKQHNAKHTFQYGTTEITEGELDVYLDGYGGAYHEYGGSHAGTSSTTPTSSRSPTRTPTMSPVSSKSDLGAGGEEAHTSATAGGAVLEIATLRHNSSNNSMDGYAVATLGDQFSALLSLRALSHIKHPPASIEAAAAAIKDNDQMDELQEEKQEGVAAAAAAACIKETKHAPFSLIHDLVNRLELHARGPPMPTAPENSLGARNLSLSTLQTLSQTIYSYCRFLHLTQTQLQDALEVEQSKFIPVPSFSFESKDTKDPSDVTANADTEYKDGEAGGVEDDECPAAPYDAAHTAALQAHLHSLLPHIATELTACRAGIRSAYHAASQVLLTEIGLTAPETPNASDKVAVDADLARIARESIADKLVQYFSEEVDRLRGASWSRVIVKVTSSAALYLDSTPELTRRIGHDYQGWPILSGERFRRRVQLFLLLRGLLSRVDTMTEYAVQGAIPMPPAPAPAPASAPALAPPAAVNEKESKESVFVTKLQKPRAGPDDLLFGLAEDAELALFTPLGDETLVTHGDKPNGISASKMAAVAGSSRPTADSTYAAGKLLQMKGRRFLEAKSTYLHAPPDNGNGGSTSNSARGTPPNGGTSPAAPAKSWSSNLSTFFGFGNNNNNSNNSSTQSTPNKTPPREGMFSGFGRSSSSSNDNGLSSASPVKRMFGSLTPTMHSAYGTVASSVLFVQHQHLLVLVESTPKSIADDSYKILISVPLANTEVFVAAPRKLRVLVRSYCPHLEHMECLGNPPPEPAGTQDVLLGRSSTSVAALRGIYADDAMDEDIYLGNSDVSALSTLLQPRPVVYLWQTTLDFDNEKMCNLACAHVTGRAKSLRAEKHAAVRALLAKAVAVTAPGV